MNQRTMEWFIARVAIPIGGLAGVIYEELHGTVDPELLLLYGAMMGLSVTPVIGKMQEKFSKDNDGRSST